MELTVMGGDEESLWPRMRAWSSTHGTGCDHV